MSQDIIIIGAGPAGLTAGLELVRAGKTGVTVLEATQDIGGISKTVNYKGNRIDIGGHRFFSKSDWVMDWWRDILPVALPPGAGAEREYRLAYQGAQRLLGSHEIHATEGDESVMLVRNRLSRIYWGGKFFDYPLKPGVGMALEPGMTFTIEPMINAGKPGIRELADGWTIVTKDHSLSAQWEHTVAVTETGVEVLTRSNGSQPAP